MKKLFNRAGKEDNPVISGSPTSTSSTQPMFPGHHGISIQTGANVIRRASDFGPREESRENGLDMSGLRRDLPGDLPTSLAAPTRPMDIPIRAPIPSYDQATSPSSPSYTFLAPGTSFSGQSLGTEGYRSVRDPTTPFGASPASPRHGSVFEDEEDDPLLPRLRRLAPPPNLIPLPTTRRNTMPHLHRPLTPPDSDSSHTDNLEMDLDEIAENPLEDITQIPLDLPHPPEQPPGYSAHLAQDELRLISTVHLDQNHPAAALFSQMTSAVLSPLQTESDSPSSPPAEEIIGGKKCRMIITTGVEHINANGSGPAFMRLRRGSKVEGRIEIGNVDHVTGLEIAIMGYVSTSFYIRGQYTLIDTMPLARRQVILYPPKSTSESSGTPATAGSGSSDGPAQNGSNNQSPTSVTTPATTIGPPPSQPPPLEEPIYSNSSPKTVTVGKDTFLAPNQTFSFSLEMPSTHCRGTTVDLPPSAQIFQVGMQAGIEYVLRLKMARKSWRMSEHIGLPIIYEPRAYISPRRLRILTTNDALNPGWRTIRLNGGKPLKSNDGPDLPPNAAGVECSLLLPSPPIVFIPDGGTPPPIPFHLHFHSSAILPLSTFSDPKECTFTIRLMRVATMLIGCEREVRRQEVPSVVEIWQEGGPRLTLTEPEVPKSTRRASTSGPSSGSGTTERRRSFTDRRPSFLKRKSTLSPGTSPMSPTGDAPLLRQISNAPSEAPIMEEEQRDITPTIVAPLSLGATDVHLLGQLTIKMPLHGPSHVRNLIQSFTTPEVGISYLIEVGLKPNNGAVKEAFSHVWGGGIIEVVLGHRVRS